MSIEVKNKKIKISEIILLSVCSLTILVFIALLIYVKIFSVKYIVPIVLVLLVSIATVFLTILKSKESISGKLLGILLCIVLTYCSVFLYKFDCMITAVADADIKLDNISVIVLKDDPAQNIKDASEYVFGINSFIDTEVPGNILQIINNELGVDIKTKPYSDFYSMIEAMYAGEVKAILINEGFRGMINNLSQSFDVNTRVLDNKYIEAKIETSNDYVKEDKSETNEEIENTYDDIIDEKFIVYISGIDTFGPIATTSRSDTNILAAINVKTRQIQLVSTPRDYYIEIPMNGWQLDKLTHSGVYGVDVSMGALEKLYDIKIDYFLRINETSFVNFVDALGGIEVNSDYEFYVGDEIHIIKGKNYLDGITALLFAEERKSFAEGDIQRGRNQMIVIDAIFNKAMSPAILPNLGDMIDAVSDNFETNMSKDKITGLIKMQLNKGGEWELNTYTVNGTGAVKKTYSSGERQLSVVLPDQETVDEAKEKIRNVMSSTIQE